MKVAIDRSPWRIVGLMTLAACGSSSSSSSGSGSAPRLAADHVPPELHGLLPGVSTEADVLAAWPEAVAVRHQSLGGDRPISLDGAPAVKIVRGDEQAWLVEVGGVHRIASLRLRTTRTCDAVLAAFGPTRPGPCTPTNRRPSPGEHQVCGATPDGTLPITITCHAGSLRLRLHLPDRTGSGFEG